jgi:hypothetical protein
MSTIISCGLCYKAIADSMFPLRIPKPLIILTVILATKEIAHHCPNPECDTTLAIYHGLSGAAAPMQNDYTTEVPMIYNPATANTQQSRTGITTGNFEIGGYARLHVGNQYFIQPDTSSSVQATET